jgi:hypothetical protein
MRKILVPLCFMLSIIFCAACGQSSHTSANFNATTSTGTVSLNWTRPALNADGTPLTDLAGYNIYSGSQEGSLNLVTTISDPTVLSIVLPSPGPGTWYYAVTAFNSAGGQSVLSNIGSKSF